MYSREQHESEEAVCKQNSRPITRDVNFMVSSAWHSTLKGEQCMALHTEGLKERGIFFAT
jgi:hypothetical protein